MRAGGTESPPDAAYRRVLSDVCPKVISGSESMIFAFTGFSQQGADRVFSFELLPRSPECSTFEVRADIAVARRYKISLQQLPILCRGVLENQPETARSHTATYSAADMLVYANARNAAEANRKARRPSPSRRTAAGVDSR